MADYISNIIPFALGGIAHILLTLVEESKRLGKHITIKSYQDLHPYQLALSSILSILAFWMVGEMNQLNTISAIACGYMGDSMVKKYLKSNKFT